MEILDQGSQDRPVGQFEGKLLIAMPDMESDLFAESVIYLGAHNDDGAMGFIINRPSSISLGELLDQADTDDTQIVARADVASERLVHDGGPVDPHRGFVLHSGDYQTDNTVSLSGGMALTSTMQILHAIAAGGGPHKSLILLGYSGWGPGQLENEMRTNTWLVTEGDASFVFDGSHETMFERALQTFGIGRGNFITEGGRA